MESQKRITTLYCCKSIGRFDSATAGKREKDSDQPDPRRQSYVSDMSDISFSSAGWGPLFVYKKNTRKSATTWFWSA
jgi:hypothetical protein